MLMKGVWPFLAAELLVLTGQSVLPYIHLEPQLIVRRTTGLAPGNTAPK
jgi:hypothetical protein